MTHRFLACVALSGNVGDVGTLFLRNGFPPNVTIMFPSGIN